MHGDRPIRTLLTELIDYAGLFPPAGLDMAAAVRNYASWLSGDYSWMLGRFIVPAARVDEFERAASPYFGGREWKIGILGMPERLLTGRGYVIDAIELKPAGIEDIRPGLPNTYFEITAGAEAPLEATEAMIDAIAKTGARAKIRTGGLTADAFPAAARIARFQWLCHRAGIAFKATAGLHHAKRGVYPFTYEPGSARGTMHGFLNVFLAAVLIHTGASEGEATRLLEDCSPDAFHFDDESVRWQSHRLGGEQIRQTRERFAIGFGSCSFEEPVNDLEALGLL